MDVRLLDNMHTHNKSDLPNWLDIQNLIPSTISNLDLGDFATSHESTKSKITFADYHYNILNQLYRPNDTIREIDTDSWARAEMHCIITNLYSALDSLGYEINLAYQFAINVSKIHIYHKHNKYTNNCFRCSLNQVKDNVDILLNTELDQSWFKTFQKLRNQIVHKSLPIMNVNIGESTTSIKIPNDPTNTDPQLIDYSQNLEINQYCKDVRNNVVKIIESVYPLIFRKIKDLYNI